MKAIYAVLMLTVISGSAFAQKPTPGTNPGGGGNPCRGDAMRLCSEFMSDPQARIACMRRHRTELSPACLDQARQQRGR